MEISTQYLAIDDGRFNTFLRDIADRKRAEEDILNWKYRYEAAVASTGNVPYGLDSETNEVTYGGIVKDIFGYAKEEISGDLSKWIRLIHVNDR